MVLDVHEKVAQDPVYHATVEDADAWEKKHDMQIPQGAVVMVRSDWSKDWEKYEQEGLPATFPGVELSLLRFLHEEREILFHGHEPLDTDMTATLEGEAWLMHNNFAQAEGVKNLHQLPESGCLLSIGFAKPLGGTGGYARFVAICPPGSDFGETVEESPGIPLPRQKAPLRRDEDGVFVPTKEAEPTSYCALKTPLGCEDGTGVWGKQRKLEG